LVSPIKRCGEHFLSTQPAGYAEMGGKFCGLGEGFGVVYLLSKGPNSCSGREVVGLLIGGYWWYESQASKFCPF